jgi:hypothetical protein
MEDDMATDKAVQRGALYYPYIHIHDENWLKATLLCFGQVRRMVPDRFTKRDDATITPYGFLDGPYGPLLDEARIHDPAVHQAQRVLREKFEANLDVIAERFKKENTPEEFQSGPASFQIHRGKLLESIDETGLASLLESQGLAWQTTDQGDESRDEWLTMHPRLGKAVMSTLALAIERNEGLQIVTPSRLAHNNLLTNSEDQILETLLEIPKPPAQEDLGKKVDELAQVVITTGFDLTELKPEDIKALIDDGNDLQKFREAVASFAELIPGNMGPEFLRKAMQAKAEKLLDEWRESKFSSLMGGALLDLSVEKFPEKVGEKIGEKLLEGLPGLAEGAIKHSLLAAVPGVVISLLLVSGVRAYFQSRNHPLRYLNRIQKTVDRSFGSIYVPQWIALAGGERVPYV